MKELLFVLQIIVSLLLIAAITAQARTGGFARSIGSAQSFTRRGLERLVFRATFVLAFLFIAIATIQLVV